MKVIKGMAAMMGLALEQMNNDPLVVTRGKNRRMRAPNNPHEKTHEKRIEEGRRAPKPKPIPKFKHRQQKRRRK